MKLEEKLITIDGPSASGKGLASRNVALDLGFRLLDSGLLYRAYGYLFTKYDSHDQAIDAFNKLGFSYLENKETLIKEDNIDITASLRTQEIANNASIISSDPVTRENLLSIQRSFISEEGLVAESMSIFVLTNYFNRKEKQYSNSIKLQLPYPTNNSIKIVKRALEGIRKIYREGYRYKKAGVILYGLTKAKQTRGLLDYDRENSDSIMNTLDRINERYGSSTIRLASEGVDKSWSMRRESVSPCYTTRFDDLVEAKLSL